MSNFYGRGDVRIANTPQMTGNRESFKQNTFVQMTGTAQTIPFAAADVSIACATVVADHLSNISATDSITISQTGFYQVNGSILMNGAVGATTSMRIAFAVNGVLATGPIAALAVNTLAVESSRVMLLTAGQVLSLWGQAQGADYTTANVSITCRYLGPA